MIDQCEREHKKLPPVAQAGLTEVVGRLRWGATRGSDTTKLSGAIWEIRWRKGNNHYRILYARDPRGGGYLGLLAAYKNQQKTPKGWIETAKKRLAAEEKRAKSEQAGNGRP